VTAITTADDLSHTYGCARDYHLFGPGPKRVLSLDGGGVRGAISVAFLERIEDIFSQRQRTLIAAELDARQAAEADPAALADIRQNLRPIGFVLPTGSTSSAAHRPAR
jgi:hypothetical protein